MSVLPFALISLVHVAGEALESKMVRYVSKPFLMPALALYYALEASGISWIMIAALAGGWLGDLFLMIPDRGENRRFFQAGLVAFLLGHLFYVWVFWEGAGHVTGAGLLGSLFFTAYGVVVFIKLRPHMGGLFIPITLYIAVIALMGIATSLSLGNQSLSASLTVVAGALIFMVSDTVNAWNRFAAKVPHERLITMPTYLAGQFLLVYGFLQFS